LIPGLERAEFVRLGSLHRNTFVNAPALLQPTLQLRTAPRVFLAGQLIGVEGYVESAAAGLLAGMNAARLLAGTPLLVPPATTAHGSLLAYVTDRTRRSFQPMNANYGLFPPLERRLRGRDKKLALATRALAAFDGWMAGQGLVPQAVAASSPSLVSSPSS
jgi:methylenetetrahydrofolate--tRNA-(uracil-5-)-methyltransferase